MNNKKRVFYRIMFCISLVVFIICAIYLIKIFTSGSSDRDDFSNTTHETSVAEETTVLPDNPINFKKLQNENKDIYAWIEIPDTKINYAILQSSSKKDDLFYLDHNMYGEYEFSGSIFSQKQNSKDFSDPVTVLYGHNMINGSMFNNLHKFKDADFFKKHKTMYVYTPGHILEYEIVSAYIFDDRHILNTYNFSDKKELKSYIETITDPRSLVKNVRKDLKITTKDKILTLSTCTSSDSQRYLVQGVLKNDTITN